MKDFFWGNRNAFLMLVGWCCFMLISIVTATTIQAQSGSPHEFNELVNQYYQNQPAKVVAALAVKDPEEFSLFSPEILVKVSYAAAISANSALTKQLTDILLSKATALDELSWVGQAYYNRGAAYAIVGNHDLALDSLLLALASFENTTNDKEIARIKGALALIYVEMGEYRLAQPYFDEALKSHRLRNDEANIAIALQNRAFMKVFEKNYESAKQDLSESIRLSEALGINSNLPVIYKNLGRIAVEQGEKDLAIAYFERAIAQTELDGAQFHQSEILREYANLYFRFDDLVKAKALLQKSITIGQEYKLLKQIRNSYLLLAKIHAELGDYKDAYVARENATLTTERMGESNIAANLSRLERYTTSIKEQNNRLVLEKEKEIATLAAERQYLLRNFFIAVAGLAILLSIYVIRRLMLSKQQAVIFEKQSKIDSLTGIWNRRACEAQLVRLCARDSRLSGGFSIAMLDIDNFKRINDEFGHDVGDSVIIAICNIIEDNLRPSDMLCRWGGEEFVIILDGSKTAKAFDICERIRDKIQAADVDQIGNMTVSIGISTFENDDIYELIKRGDQALYHAKHLGRNQVIVKNKSAADFSSADSFR